jgi:hypothetical protein
MELEFFRTVPPRRQRALAAAAAEALHYLLESVEGD